MRTNVSNEMGAKKRSSSSSIRNVSLKSHSDSDNTTTLQVSDDSRPNERLHSPSLPSSPSQGIASSEEESVAELDDVSEGSCSSVEDFHGPITRRDSELLNNVAHFVAKRLPSARSPSSKQLRGISASAADAEAASDASTSKIASKKTAVAFALKETTISSSTIAASPSSIKAIASPSLASSSIKTIGSPSIKTIKTIQSPSLKKIIQSSSIKAIGSSSVKAPPRPPSTSTQPVKHDMAVDCAASQQSQPLHSDATTAVVPGSIKTLPPSSTASSSLKSIQTTSIKAAPVSAFMRPRKPDTGVDDSDSQQAQPLTSDAQTPVPGPLNSLPNQGHVEASVPLDAEHRPISLPRFKDTRTCMWTSSHEANCPSEDRSSSLVNVLLQPLPPNFDSETQLPPLEPDYKTLIRLSLWSVIDGHGGGCVATYASEVLLPHIAASISRALGCAIVDRGICTVNGQLRDANALDLDGLIKTSDRSLGNPNSIHYRSPFERSDSEEEGDGGINLSEVEDDAVTHAAGTDRKQIQPLVVSEASIASSLLPGSEPGASVSSVKTSVKTAASNKGALLGTHSPREVAAITRAITESFLAVDEGWINSIDPVATHQTSCQTNGRWNSGACALVVFTIQRLDWTSVYEPDREKELRGPAKDSGHDTSQNRDAARRRMLDYATRAKSASSISTISSTSSLTTEEAVNASELESEITETEGEDDQSVGADTRRRNPCRSATRAASIPKESLISATGGCSSHCYRAHDAILYTAHVGDCRAVMLGSAPPRTIKVRDSLTDHPDTTDDESSHHSSDETECLSSSDHDAVSSDDEDIEVDDSSTAATSTPSYMTYMRRPARRQSRRRSVDDSGANAPFIALPPLALEKEEGFKSVDFDADIDYRRKRCKDPSDSSISSQESDEMIPLIYLPPVTRPIDLTTDHSAYNPAEVTAVLRRCNNAPRAISAGVGGGIKRVAGSLAVTRALGDAYLKTPLLSFLPYKSHAPYITARPEVNCRPVVKGGDKVLILATDGVWERAGGEDVLRWVRNFYAERIAKAERRSNRRSNVTDRAWNEDAFIGVGEKYSQESSEQEQQERLDDKNEMAYSTQRKRELLQRSPSPPSKRRKRSRRCSVGFHLGWSRRSNVADVIVRRVLNKVRRARNISSLHALMALPQGRARRSKHDDITACVVDLSAFVS